ncbi:hypothetical protein MHU86_15928 [Fragilaria crotonensis]|nr:hypothetical protein MHU86_15928 [Fragilaria crotonensis]
MHQPQSLNCIYLRYNNNVQEGGHELLHLPTIAVITRRNVTTVPITPTIIKQVHAIAELEDVPAGLKIENCPGQVSYDSAWIAGMDFNEDELDDDSDQEDFEGDKENQLDDDERAIGGITRI